MLLIGGIVIEIAAAIAFLTYYFNTINLASRLGAEALETARAGVDDAIIRVVRDKGCPNASCPASYQVTTSTGRVADVDICRDACVGGRTQILSAAAVLNRRRTVEALLIVDPLTGQVTIDVIREI